MPAPVEWSDPCARAAALTTAYYALLSGSRETRIRTKTLEAEEEVHFATADLATLKRQMELAQAACEAANGLRRPRRFCATAG